MRHFRVLVRGENFLIALDGKPVRMGFYTTRFVEADDPKAAELLAVDLIRGDAWLTGGAVLNQQSDPPMLFADEIEVVPKADVQAVSGFSFFLMEVPDA